MDPFRQRSDRRPEALWILLGGCDRDTEERGPIDKKTAIRNQTISRRNTQCRNEFFLEIDNQQTT